MIARCAIALTDLAVTQQDPVLAIATSTAHETHAGVDLGVGGLGFASLALASLDSLARPLRSPAFASHLLSFLLTCSIPTPTLVAVCTRIATALGPVI